MGVVTRFDKERDVSASLSAVVIIHPPAGKRLTPGVIVGVTNQRTRNRASYTPVSIPEGVDPEHPAVVGRTEVVDAQHRRPDRSARISPSPSRLTFPSFPDVRYDYGSIGDEINNTLRTSVRMHWRF